MSCNPTRKSRTRNAFAFSLVELMVVLVIIGLLAGVVTLNVRHYLIKGKQNTARMEISTIAKALEEFYSVYGRYPTNEEGLEVLSQKTDKLPEPLLTQKAIDPWSRPYQYNHPGRNGPYEVLCYGADGREGGEGADGDMINTDLKAN